MAPYVSNGDTSKVPSAMVLVYFHTGDVALLESLQAKLYTVVYYYTIIIP